MEKAKSILFLIGTDATNEEAGLLKKEFPKADFFYHNGLVKSSKENRALDRILRQSDKTPNTLGLENLGLTSWNQEYQHDLVIFYRNGRAKMPQIQKGSVILWGVYNWEEVQSLKNQVLVLLPGLSTLEKSGSYTNVDGITQRFIPAITHKGHGQSLEQVLRRPHGAL
jgi:NADH dehydrogenase/NADH:ubiquinone oxidoreductase subunit G